MAPNKNNMKLKLNEIEISELEYIRSNIAFLDLDLISQLIQLLSSSGSSSAIRDLPSANILRHAPQVHMDRIFKALKKARKNN